MSETAVIAAFPRRPLVPVEAPTRGRTRMLVLLGTLLAFLPGLYLAFNLWSGNGLRSDLRARGVPAEVLSAEGHCFSKRQITGDKPRGCKLDITYRLRQQEGGGERSANVWLDGAAPLYTPSALYDPADPDRVMLGREVNRDLRWTELVGVPLLLAIPLLVLLGWLATIKSALIGFGLNPQPAVLSVNQVEHNQTGALTVRFLRPDGKPDTRMFAPGSGPLFVASATGEQKALALLQGGKPPFIIKGDLSEFDFSETEKAAIHQAAAA